MQQLKCFISQGEEIGMTDLPIPKVLYTLSNTKTYDRDRCRTPMQWDGTTNAGFSTARKTWLPLVSNYDQVNVEIQKSNIRSHLNVFQKLIELRKRPTMKYGETTFKDQNEHVLIFKRQINGDADVIVVILNFSPHNQRVNVKKAFNELPDQMETYVSSVHFQTE